MPRIPQTAQPKGESLRLLPLLGLFGLMAILHAKGDFEGDGWRYLMNARNLMHGSFASPETLMFWNGPGYPLFLVPFLALKLPLVLARLANALFLFFAVVRFHGLLRLAGIGTRRLGYAYAMGILLLLHGPLLGMIMTESLSVYLVCGAAYHFSRSIGPRADRPQVLLAGFHLGYLALTKVFFGYALEFSLAAALGIRLWAGLGRTPSAQSGAKGPAGAAAAACALGLLVCVPYLMHTWSTTGKANLWGNSGGLQLYYMSLPEKQFLGDWLNFEAVLEHPEYFAEHVDFLRETLKLDYVKQDSVFKRAAAANCREHPGKCILNWRANLNRMAFGFPTTYYPGTNPELVTGNRAFIYALPFALFLMMGVPGWLGRRLVPAWVHACLAFAVISLGGMSVVCAIPRQAFPLLPLLGLWSVVVAERTLRIEGRWRPNGK